MKFDDLFPDVRPGEMVIDKYNITEDVIGAYYLKSGTPDTCMVCGIKCTWIEINFQNLVCSEECDYKAWDVFRKICEQEVNRKKPFYVKWKDFFIYQFLKFLK